MRSWVYSQQHVTFIQDTTTNDEFVIFTHMPSLNAECKRHWKYKTLVRILDEVLSSKKILIHISVISNTLE